MKKLKVLIIPSWYPNKADPLWGNYFIKQASALNEYADITMLHIERVGLKQIKDFFENKKTDGFNNELHPFKFYKKTTLNYKSFSLDFAYKKYVECGIKAYKKVESEIGKPDVILVESVLPAGLIAKEIYEKEGIPYVVHAHSENIMLNEAYKKYVISVMKNAKEYMAVNEKIKNVVESIRNDKCNLIPNFIDCSKFSIKKTRKDKDFVLLNVSNFYKVKCLDILLKALDIVVNKKNYKNVKLKIVGRGEYKYYYESISKSLNLNDNVEFLGYIENEKLPDIYKNVDVLCVSSSFETFCIPIVEAFSAGLPVISTSCDGPLEIVEKNTGIITPINDIDAYADAIIKMIKTYDKYDKNEIRKYVVNKYDKEVVCKNIIKILEKCIK